MRGTAAEYLAMYILLENGYDVANVLRPSSAQDIVLRVPATNEWRSANVKRAYSKVNEAGIWINTVRWDGHPYDATEIDYIVAVRPPENSPAYWADLWLIPIEELVHKQGPHIGLIKGRVKLTDKWKQFLL